jgi:glucokinase
MGASQSASRHLGLDLGGTNIKWAVVERDGGEWRTLGHDRVATPTAGGPKEVVAELARVGKLAAARWPGVESVGIGVPGLYYPERGATRFLVNIPGDWDGMPVAAEVGGALGLPAHLINDARAFGLAELRLGAGRGASSMVGLTLGTGIGGVIAIEPRRPAATAPPASWTQTIIRRPHAAAALRLPEAFARADRLAAACRTDTAERRQGKARQRWPAWLQ